MASIHLLKVLTLVVVANTMIFAVLGQCQGDLQGLMQQCARFVQRSGPKIAPSESCCQVLQTVDLPCICQHITPDAEQLISMEKSVFVASSCGKPLLHGTVCGSYIVP